MDEYFEGGGGKAMHPGGFGIPSEDCNCRCCLLQRARWAITDEEFTKMNGDTGELVRISEKDFQSFKDKCIKVSSRKKELDKREEKLYNYGAYNNSNDPDGKKRDKHAKRYYESIRNSKKENIVDTISQNSGIDKESVSKMYDHLFINEHNLNNKRQTFFPDYYIAESVQRLRSGINIQKHDLTLIRHEAMEYDLMSHSGMEYLEAHEKVNEFFNYGNDLNKWLSKNE